MKKQVIYLISVLLLCLACGENKKEKPITGDLDSIGELYNTVEKQNNITAVADSIVFTAQDWKDFEAALTKEFGDNIYPTFHAYEKAIDSCGLLDTVSALGYISLLNTLVKKNDLGLLGSCNSLLNDAELDHFLKLASALINVVNSSTKLTIKNALANTTQHLLRGKDVSPKIIIEATYTTLGKNNFDKKICQVTAVLYIVCFVL